MFNNINKIIVTITTTVFVLSRSIQQMLTANDRQEAFTAGLRDKLHTKSTVYAY